jgi:uncharacterized protein
MTDKKLIPHLLRSTEGLAPTVSGAANVRNGAKRRTRVNSSEWVRAGASEIHGRGVYARRDIPDGTRVIEYVGERITKAEAQRRELRRLALQRKGGDGCVTIFALNKRHDLDGRSARNVAHFINHSCAPNCRAEAIRGRIWIVARRDIAAGDELTFDYGYGFQEWRLHPCRCGAKRCVGFIVGSAQRWRVRRILRRTKAAEVSP